MSPWRDSQEGCGWPGDTVGLLFLPIPPPPPGDLSTVLQGSGLPLCAGVQAGVQGPQQRGQETELSMAWPTYGVRRSEPGQPSLVSCPSPQDQPPVHTVPEAATLPRQRQSEVTALETRGSLPPGTPPPSQNLIFITAIIVVLHNGTYINTSRASAYLVKIHEFRSK